MVASRVISSHEELVNAGTTPHAVIDSHITATEFLIVSSTLTAPSSSRKIVAGNGIQIQDNGPGNTYVISATGSISVAQQISWSEKPVGSIDGVNTQFVLNNNPTPSASLMLFLNGVLQLQSPSADYTIASGNIVNFTYVPQASGSIQATYPFVPASQISWYEIPSGLANGINTQFTLANTPNPLSSLMFFVNGVLQKQGSQHDYIMSGNIVQLIVSYTSGSSIAATYPY